MSYRKTLILLMLFLALGALSVTSAQDISGKITVWGWASAIKNVVEDSGVVEDFKVVYPDVEVEMVYYDLSDVETNLSLALTAGQGACDVCLIASFSLPEFIRRGGIRDITDLVLPYIDQVNDYRWPDAELDGHYYAFPWDGGPVVAYYRADVFEKAGLPTDPAEVDALLATWDGLLEVCRTIKEATGQYCLNNNKANNNADLYQIMLWSRGLGYYDADSGDLTIASAENIETLELLGQFWEEDLVSDTQMWTDTWNAEISSPDSSIAIHIGASWFEGFFKTWLAPETAGLWRVARIPAFPDGARSSSWGGSTFLIPEQSQNPEAAWAFIEFVLARPESQVKMFKISGFIPALETSYDDPVFQEGDDFFGGQGARSIYLDVIRTIPRATIYGPGYNMMNAAVALAIQRYAAGEVSAADALADAQAEVEANLE
jgi:lactose/L-arabinose transport system substrate-binding protein